MSTDTSLAVGIFSVLLLLGILMPFINEAFQIQGSTTDVEGFVKETGEGLGLNWFSVALSIFKMFTWTFGALHWTVDSLLLILRFSLIWLIIRVVRGV